jgi:hypothetical protein
LVLWWRDSEVEQQNRQLRSDIAYDPTVPDRWEQLMKTVFKSENRFDRIALKHMVWILKRRFLGMDVGMIHRPMLLNIFGPPGSGKSGFYTEYLLTPFSQQSKKETTELVELIKDERQHFNFGKHHVIVFTEKSGMERMDVEALKGLLDMEYINPRILGMNANDRLKNIATLFSSSNKRLRNCFPEMNPRKWYEITMPSRSDQEIREYVVERDSIPVMDLYRCVDENQESELLTNWDQVQEEIIYRCGYIDSIMTNLVEFSKRDHLGKEVLLNGFVEYYCSKDENREVSSRIRVFVSNLRTWGLRLERSQEDSRLFWTPILFKDWKNESTKVGTCLISTPPLPRNRGWIVYEDIPYQR